MVIITLIGEHQAKEGHEFIYMGPTTECRECRLKTVCFNLDFGSTYRITALRDVHHECKMHEDGVRVVEVERIPIRAAVPAKLAIEGSTITFEGIRCGDLACESYAVCHPAGVGNATKWKVSKVHGDIKCPEEKKLILVEIE